MITEVLNFFSFFGRNICYWFSLGSLKSNYSFSKLNRRSDLKEIGYNLWPWKWWKIICIVSYLVKEPFPIDWFVWLAIESCKVQNTNYLYSAVLCIVKKNIANFVGKENNRVFYFNICMTDYQNSPSWMYELALQVIFFTKKSFKIPSNNDIKQHFGFSDWR